MRTPRNTGSSARSALRVALALALAAGTGVAAAQVPAACGTAFTPAYAIQGSGAATPLSGATVTVQGIVVGDHEGPAPALRGFYLQDAAGDGSAATSDAVFVFNGNANDVALGQIVRVSGIVGEFQGQTQISATPGTVVVCGSGSVTPVDVFLPVATADFLERYEGMLVRLPQTLYVTEHFQLGRFGQVVLSVDGRQAQPTNVVDPGPAAIALQAQNLLGRIILDDAPNSQNPDPIVFGRGGAPLSASNTLRGGDAVAGIVGVLTYTWAGNAASGNAFRVRPIGALGGSVPNFEPSNPRPTVPPAAGGSLKVAGFNVLNFFNNVAGCTGGVGGAPIDCRGAGSDAGSAANQAAQFPIEFPRQGAKIVAALTAIDADVVGLIEIENDGYGAGSAQRNLVDQLNSATSAGNYALVDIDAGTGQVDAAGSDAIKVAFIYKPARVTPVGRTAALNSIAFVNGGDSGPRNRPALAQAFEQASDGARFIAVVNHLKSKGSACNAPDAGDGQGNCNTVRTNAANLLRAWLAGDPTGTTDPDVLILGDLNAYALEDPIGVFTDNGWRDLIASYGGAAAYGYVFDGQWGYLDHALATPSLANGQVAGAAHWHINADEPNVLDYNVNFKSPGQVASLYAPDAFRSSDHDPVIVGLALTPPTIIDGTSASETIVGTAGDDVITGGPGRDTLTGGSGRDRFVYRSVLDGGDTITDFRVGVDALVFRPLLQSLGLSGGDPLGSGVVTCSASPGGALIGVDTDGAAGPSRSRPIVLLSGVACSVVGRDSFVF